MITDEAEAQRAIREDAPVTISGGTTKDRIFTAAKLAAIPELVAALEQSRVALDDWLNTYAAEMCDEKRVDEARTRIMDGGGTLAYIADIQQANRALLARVSALEGKP